MRNFNDSLKMLNGLHVALGKLKDLIDDIPTASPLEPATATKLGGVKIGEGVNVTEDGVISTNGLSLNNGETIIGTWGSGDNKVPIYCQTWTKSSISSGQRAWTLSNELNYTTIQVIDYFFNYYNSNGYSYSNKTGTDITCEGSLNFNSNFGYSINNPQVTVFYIKKQPTQEA